MLTVLTMPVTPTKSSNLPSLSQGIIIDNYLPSTPPAEMAPFMPTQSTITASPSSTHSRKRKLESLLSTEDMKRPKTSDGAMNDGVNTPTNTLRTRTLGEYDDKVPRTVGGFIDEDDDDEDALAEFQDGGYMAYSTQGTTTGTETMASQQNIFSQKTRGPFIDEDDNEDEDGMDVLKDSSMNNDATLLQMMSEPVTTGESQPNATSIDMARDDPVISAGNPPVHTVKPTTERKGLVTIRTCAGRAHRVSHRKATNATSYERLVASRSKTAEGKAQRSYYGIEIHRLLDDAAGELKDAKRKEGPAHIERSIETAIYEISGKKKPTPMWTEKYRARRFAELIGDERTHRSVLRWLKSWDHIVFPGIAKSKHAKNGEEEEGEFAHRKILMLTGPPGLGKTTLAHVCAQQAGYEVLEINASDERSRDVVKGRIRDAVGTENVKSISAGADSSKASRSGRPVCVVVDEVDGVVGGAGSGGEGGFIKALIDLVMTDQKNATARPNQNSFSGRKRKGDNFRLLRPIILICNDAYHSSLRPLRTANVAEVIHVRHVPIENAISRLKLILTKENIQFDADGVRRLCEASWGMSAKKDRTEKSRGVSEGDIRSILVSAEWVARKLRAESAATPRLTKTWLEDNILNDAESGSRGLGRGGVREITDRVFIEGAGFPAAPVGANSFTDPFDQERTKTPVGVAELRRRHASSKLCEMIDASGEYDRCATDCFIEYPTRTYQDDTFLSKPNAAYDWLHFHDMISSKIYSNQDWELNPYMSQSTLAFHHLFAGNGGSSNKRKFDDDKNEEEEHPFSGPRADFAAFEATKQNKSVLVGFQSTFSAPLLRLFRSVDSIATDLVPNLMRMLSPEVKPVIVRGSEHTSVASVRKESERALVRAAVRVMSGLNMTFEKIRIGNEGAHAGWAYRMEP